MASIVSFELNIMNKLFLIKMHLSKNGLEYFSPLLRF